MEESNWGVFIVIQRCCLLQRTSRNYSDYPDYVRILFYSGSPEIHRLFDDAFVWSGWDRSIHTYIALIDMDQYGHVTEYISVYSVSACTLSLYSVLYSEVYSSILRTMKPDKWTHTIHLYSALTDPPDTSPAKQTGCCGSKSQTWRKTRKVVRRAESGRRDC